MFVFSDAVGVRIAWIPAFIVTVVACPLTPACAASRSLAHFIIAHAVADYVMCRG